MEPEVTAKAAQDSLECLLDILGWELAMEDKKRKKFDARFTALGVVVDLSEISSGIVKLRNKPGRIEGIQEQARNLFVRGTVGFKEALSIRGKLSFAEGQNYGRIAAPVAHILSRCSRLACLR